MNTSLKQIALSLCVLGAAGATTVQAAPNAQGRIVGGSAIGISTAPSTVALISNYRLAQSGSYSDSLFCGGTVIAARWVLTAAHCLVLEDGSVTPASELSVMMGNTTLDSPVNQPVGVNRVIAHSRYNARTMANDIALLELEYDAVVPAAQLDGQQPGLNDIALIAGWGALNQGSDYESQRFPGTLQGAFVRMIPGSECGSLFPVYSGEVDGYNLCAGVAGGGIDSCQGDSGGPLYRYNQNNPADVRLVGVTSWGYGCADPDAPGVYTLVSAFNDWIRSNAGNLQSQPAIMVDDQPVNNTQTPVIASATGNSLGAVGAGASGFFLLPLMGVALWMRKRVRRQSLLVQESTSQPQPQSKAPSLAQLQTQARSLAQTQTQAQTRTQTQARAQAHLPAQAQAQAQAQARTQAHLPAQAQTDPQADSQVAAHAVERFDWLRCYPVALAATVFSVALVITWPPFSKAQERTTQAAVSLLDQPIGQSRDAVIESVSQLWQLDPVCTVVRTGYGTSRRAYFLETCTFTSTSNITLCDATPTWIEYRFLERSLVQVSFEFDEIADESDYRACVNAQNALLADASNEAPRHTVTVDSDYRTSVSDTEAVARIHLIKKMM